MSQSVGVYTADVLLDVVTRRETLQQDFKLRQLHIRELAIEQVEKNKPRHVQRVLFFSGNKTANFVQKEATKLYPQEKSRSNIT